MWGPQDYAVAPGPWAALRVIGSRVLILESPEACLFHPEQLDHKLRVAPNPVGPKVADSAEDPTRIRRAAMSSGSDRCGQSGD